MMEPIAQLCEAGRRLVDLQLSPGSSGNLSVRVGDEMHISPTGASLGELRADHLSVLALDDAGARHVRGPRPSKEFGLHEAMYLRNPQASAVVHLHSTHAVAASCHPAWSEFSALPPYTPYVLMRLGNLPLVPYHPPGDPEQATALRNLDIECHGALLQNHGPIVAGDSVAQAIDRAIEVECAAQVALLAGSGARTLTDAEAEHLASSYGQPWGPPGRSSTASPGRHYNRTAFMNE